MFRRVLIASVVLLAFVAATSRASSTSISPCRQVSQPIWSPDGTQIAYYGRRWPPPTGRRNPNDILQALCTANADGTSARPLRYTVCTGKCPDPPNQLAWLPSNQLLVLRDGDILRFASGSKPRTIARGINDFSFVTNPTGTRIAVGRGSPSCLSCSGPVTILDARSGAVVGKVGGKKLDNVNPSLSPDGTKVVFERIASNDSGKTFGIWTAKADGSNLRRLVKVGLHPLWSPKVGKVAYVASAGKSVALRLISAGGGKSRALVPRNVSTRVRLVARRQVRRLRDGHGHARQAGGRRRRDGEGAHPPPAPLRADGRLVAGLDRTGRQLDPEEPEVLVDVARAGRRLQADPDLELHQLAGRRRRPAALSANVTRAAAEQSCTNGPEIPRRRRR